MLSFERGSWPGEVIVAWEHAGHRAVSVALCISFVFCILLTCIIVVTVCFLYCSVKLSLSLPTNFTFFLLVLLSTSPMGRGNRVTTCFFLASWG